MGVVISLPTVLVGESDLAGVEVDTIRMSIANRNTFRWIVRCSPVAIIGDTRSATAFIEIDKVFSERREWMDANTPSGLLIVHYIAAFGNFSEATLFSMTFD